MAGAWAELIVKLGGDGRGFDRMLDGASRRSKKFAQEHKSSFDEIIHHMGRFFSVAAVETGIHHLVESATRIKNLSQQFKVSTYEVQRLDTAAEASGQSFEDIGMGLLKFRRARIDAAQGNEQLRASFQRLGIGMRELTDSNVSDLELVMTHAAEIAKDPNLADFFGRSGGKLATIFDALGNVKIEPVSEEQINAIHDAHHELMLLRRELEALALVPIGQALSALHANGPGDFAARAGAGMIGLSPGGLMASFVRNQVREMFPPSADHPEARSAEWVGPMPEGASIVDQEELRLKILKLEESVQERIFHMQMQGATVEEKRAALLVHAQEALNRANVFAKQGKTAESAREQAAMIEAMTELNALELGAKPSKAGLGLTSNQRAGAGIMLGAGSALAIGTRQADKTVAENTKKTVEAVKELTSVVRSNSGVKPTLFGAE